MEFAQALIGSNPLDWPQIAAGAEAAGFDAVAVSDHVVYPSYLSSKYPYTPDGTPMFSPDEDWPDPWVAVGAMSSVTTDLRFLTNQDMDANPRADWWSNGANQADELNRLMKVRRAALALSREIERRAPALATSKWWKEERHGVFLDYNQNAKDRTVAAAYSVRPKPDARVFS